MQLLGTLEECTYPGMPRSFGPVLNVGRGNSLMGSISLALVDDHPIIVEGLIRVLGSQGTFTIVATGGSSKEALAIADRDHPNLMILDLSSRGSTVATIAEIKSKHPNISILVFTAEPSIEHAVSVLEAGARGYVSKSSPLDEVLCAAKAAIAGQTYVSRNFASGVIGALRNASARKITVNTLKLSAREEQIIRLLLDGKTNREISSGLGITERTVKHYMTVLMQKMNARNRVEVVIAAQNFDRQIIATSGFKGSGFGSHDQQYIAGVRSYHS